VNCRPRNVNQCVCGLAQANPLRKRSGDDVKVNSPP
jgi:hypothetical protein